MPSQHSRSQLKSRQLGQTYLIIAPLVLLAVAILAAVFFSGSIPSGDRLMVFANGIGISILCAWPFVRQPLPTLDLFQPRLLYRAIILIYYGIPTLLFAFSGYYGQKDRFDIMYVRNPGIANHTATYLFLFTLVTLLAFDLGLKISEKTLFKKGLPLPISTTNINRALALYLGFTIPIRVFQIATGAYISFSTVAYVRLSVWGTLINYLAITTTFAAQMYCLILACSPQHRTFSRLTIAVIMFGEQYLFALVSGSKLALLSVTTNLLLVLWVSRAISFLQIFLFTMATALVIAPLTRAIRSLDAFYLRSLSLWDVLPFVVETIPEYLSKNYLSLGEYLTSSVGFLSSRTDGFRTAARSLDIIINQLEPAKGATIIAALYSLVPSFILPEKGEITRKVVFFASIFFNRTLESRTGIAISQAAEWYYNFEYIGGLIACGIFALAVGVLLGIIYESPQKRIGTNVFFYGWAIYLPIAIQFLFVDLPLSNSLANGIRYTIIGTSFYFLLSLGQKKTQ